MRNTGGIAIALAAAACARVLEVPAPPGPGSVSGRLVFAVPGVPEPQPAAGAHVQLLHSNVAADSNSTGRFTLTPILTATGTLLIQFDRQADGTFARQRFVQLEDLGAGPGRDVGAGDVMLRENATVRGRVLRGDHTAEASGHKGTTIFVPEGPFTAYTGDDGSWILADVPEGALTLAFFRDGYAPASIEAVQVRSGESLSFRDVILTPAPAQATTVGVSGSLRFAPAVANASAASVNAVSFSGTTPLTVAADGSFSGSLPPGLYEMRFSMAGYSDASLPNVLATPPSIALPPVTLSPGQPPAPDAGPPPAGPAPPDARIGSPHVGAIEERFVLDGSPSSGTPGHALRFSWLQLTGATVALESPNSVQSAFLAPSTPGTLSFELTVTDAATGLAAIADTSVQFFAAPAAAITSPAVGRAGGSFQLDGSTSQGPHALTYSWRQPTGDRVALDSTTSPRPMFVAPLTAQTLGFELTVTDEVTGLFAKAQAQIAFYDAPVASATAPAKATAGAQVTLDASLSTGPANHTLSFSWRKSAGNSVVFSTNDSPSASVVTFTAPPAAQTLQFALTVTDLTTSLTGVATVSVAIDAPPHASLAQVSPQRTGATVQLDASASTVAAGSALSFHWSATPAVTFSVNDSVVAGTTSFTAPSSPGGVTVSVTVTDLLSTLQDQASTIVVIAAPPVATITNPPLNVRPSSTFTLDGSASGPQPIAYHWTVTPGASIDDATVARPTIHAGASAFTVTLVVTSSLLASDPASASIDINAAAATNPTLTMPDYTIAAAGSTVTLTASATHPDPSATFTWSWSQTGGSPVTVVGANTAQISFAAPTFPDLLTFSATVTTSDGGTSNGSVSVEVRDQTPPHVIAFDPPADGPGSGFYAKATFDKPIDPASLNGSTVQILGVLSTLRYDPLRRIVTVFPRVPLAPGGPYTFQVSGVQDTAAPPNTMAAEQQVTFTVRQPAFRLWSSTVSTELPVPGIAVAAGQPLLAAHRQSPACQGHWFLEPGASAALTEEAGCIQKPSCPLPSRRMDVVGSQAYALMSDVFCNTGTPGLLKRGNAGWTGISYPTAFSIFGDGALLRGVGAPPGALPGLSMYTYTAGSDGWTSEPIVTVGSPEPGAGAAGDGRIFALQSRATVIGANTDRCLYVSEGPSWTTLLGTDPNATGALACVGADPQMRMAYAYQDPVAAYVNDQLGAGPRQLDVAHWSSFSFTPAWTIYPNVSSGPVTTFDMVGRGDVVYVAYVRNGNLYVNRIDFSAISPITSVPGPGRNGSWSDNLGDSTSCAAADPELFLADDALWVTWSEQCAPGEWRVLAREMTESFVALTPGTDPSRAATSCLALHQANPSLPDGAYWINPTGSAPFPVWCDMTTDGGGWTLAVGVAGSTTAHITANGVSLGGLVSTAAAGKLDDPTINALKSGADPGFRFTCGSTTGYFSTSCEFGARTAATGSCNEMATAFGGPFGPPGTNAAWFGLADGAGTLVYAMNSVNGFEGGCVGGVHFNNGTVWVR
ncbi:MAG: fibrinogen-like YCDxxxxGGGW domain-containing protein [Myxococcales bacterium]